MSGADERVVTAAPPDAPLGALRLAWYAACARPERFLHAVQVWLPVLLDGLEAPEQVRAEPRCLGGPPPAHWLVQRVVLAYLAHAPYILEVAGAPPPAALQPFRGVVERLQVEVAAALREPGHRCIALWLRGSPPAFVEAASAALELLLGARADVEQLGALVPQQLLEAPEQALAVLRGGAAGDSAPAARAETLLRAARDRPLSLAEQSGLLPHLQHGRRAPETAVALTPELVRSAARIAPRNTRIALEALLCASVAPGAPRELPALAELWTLLAHELASLDALRRACELWARLLLDDTYVQAQSDVPLRLRVRFLAKCYGVLTWLPLCLELVNRAELHTGEDEENTCVEHVRHLCEFAAHAMQRHSLLAGAQVACAPAEPAALEGPPAPPPGPESADMLVCREADLDAPGVRELQRAARDRADICAVELRSFALHHSRYAFGAQLFGLLAQTP